MGEQGVIEVVSRLASAAGTLLSAGVALAFDALAGRLTWYHTGGIVLTLGTLALGLAALMQRRLNRALSKDPRTPFAIWRHCRTIH